MTLLFFLQSHFLLWTWPNFSFFCQLAKCPPPYFYNPTLLGLLLPRLRSPLFRHELPFSVTSFVCISSSSSKALLLPFFTPSEPQTSSGLFLRLFNSSISIQSRSSSTSQVLLLPVMHPSLFLIFLVLFFLCTLFLFFLFFFLRVLLFSLLSFLYISLLLLF